MHHGAAFGHGEEIHNLMLAGFHVEFDLGKSDCQTGHRAADGKVVLGDAPTSPVPAMP